MSEGQPTNGIRAHLTALESSFKTLREENGKEHDRIWSTIEATESKMEGRLEKMEGAIRQDFADLRTALTKTRERSKDEIVDISKKADRPAVWVTIVISVLTTLLGLAVGVALMLARIALQN